MFLKHLAEYAEQLEKLPLLITQKPVRYIIDLDSEGRLLNPVLDDMAELSGRNWSDGTPFAVPDILRTSGTTPRLLADDAEYTFGISVENTPEKIKRAGNRHKKYLELLERCAIETNEPDVQAVLRFLENIPSSFRDALQAIGPKGLITFCVDWAYPVDLTSVREFWANTCIEAATSIHPQQCIVCTQERAILRKTVRNIEGISGSQGTGAALISINSDVFESYGLKSSFASPVCIECAEKCNRALNDLLADRRHHIALSDISFVFWTANGLAPPLERLLIRPDYTYVRNLIISSQNGKQMPMFDATDLHMLILSTNKGRVVLRSWADITLDAVQRSLTIWFDSQRIIGSDGGEPSVFGVLDLATSILPIRKEGQTKTSKTDGEDGRANTRKDVPAGVKSDLLFAALLRQALPGNLLAQAVHRNAVEHGVTHARAALIKLLLCRRYSDQPVWKGDAMVSLNPAHPDSAYHCGRLLALIEEVQHRARPDVKAGVIERNYARASTSPALIFGKLLGDAQHDLSTLRIERRSVFDGLRRDIAEVTDRLMDKFPDSLSLEEQAIFGLGYWHQIAEIQRQRKQRGTGVSDPSNVNVMEVDDLQEDQEA